MLEIEGKFKSEYETSDAAMKAGLELKKKFPYIQVVVYGAKERTRTLVALPEWLGFFFETQARLLRVIGFTPSLKRQPRDDPRDIKNIGSHQCVRNRGGQAPTFRCGARCFLGGTPS